ncbi:MAG: cyclase family protein, partial [Flavobacteriales bacterium]|nr:cyclase family protein [Flavobacteriales bacterium]
MIASIEYKNQIYKVDLSNPIDISVPLRGDEKGVNAWYVEPMKIEPVRTDQFLGSVAEGGDVNFRNIFFNPHGNGTHTECVGHISKQVYSINDTLKTFFFFGEVISVEPEVYVGEETEWQKKGDQILTKDQIESAIKG